MQTHHIGTGLTKEEVVAIRKWCLDNDTTMSKLITEYLRKVLKGEKK